MINKNNLIDILSNNKVNISCLHVNIFYISFYINKYNKFIINIFGFENTTKLENCYNQFLKSYKLYDEFIKMLKIKHYDYMKDKLYYNIVKYIFTIIFDKIESEKCFFEDRNVSFIFERLDNMFDMINEFTNIGIVQYVDNILIKNISQINNKYIKDIIKNNKILKDKYNHILQAKNFDLL